MQISSNAKNYAHHVDALLVLISKAREARVKRTRDRLRFAQSM